jgi:aspartate racemase
MIGGNVKTIGLIGGTGWVSSVEYYRNINLGVNKKIGGLNFARLVLYSLNYNDVNDRETKEDWQRVYQIVLDAAKKLQKAEVECLVLCANTLHSWAEKLQTEISLPIIHIATATANEIKKKKLSKIGLLGTRQTMTEDFYKIELKKQNIEMLIPDKDDVDYINDKILNEMLKNTFKPKTKARFLEIIEKLKMEGAQGIVLGCTEIPLLIKQNDCDLPLFDTTAIHSNAVVDFALN